MSPNRRNFQKVVFDTLRLLARILLRAGLESREFVELARLAYVDAASELFGPSGKDASISEISRRTGLPRRQVSRLKTKLTVEQFSHEIRTTSLESEVLHRWYTDTNYLDNQGVPLPLSLRGEKHSLEALFRECGEEAVTDDTLTRLIDSGSVELDNETKCRPLKRHSTYTTDFEGLAWSIEYGVALAAQTLLYNLDASEGEKWFQRTVHSHPLDREAMHIVRRVVRSRATDFVESIDDAIAGYEKGESDSPKNDDDKTICIGVFYTEREA